MTLLVVNVVKVVGTPIRSVPPVCVSTDGAGVGRGLAPVHAAASRPMREVTAAALRAYT